LRTARCITCERQLFVSGLPELTTNSAFKELIRYQWGEALASPDGALLLSVPPSLRASSIPR
jgi:hypothetical protein